MTSYDAKDCTITFDDVNITGLGEDMVTGAKDEEFFSTSVGAQGDVVVNTTNNPLGTVTLTLQATSPQLPMLIAAGRSGLVAPLWVTNKKLSRKFGGSQSRVKNFPEESWSAEASDVEIEIQVFDYDETAA